MKTRIWIVAIMVIVLVSAVTPVVAGKPDDPGKPVKLTGTLTVVGELPTTVGSAVTLEASWSRFVSFPALWFSCYQSGVRVHSKTYEPLTQSVVDFGIPFGPEWWDADGGAVTCTADLMAYDVRWQPYVVVREIVPLASVSFDLALR